MKLLDGDGLVIELHAAPRSSTGSDADLPARPELCALTISGRCLAPFRCLAPIRGRLSGRSSSLLSGRQGERRSSQTPEAMRDSGRASGPMNPDLGSRRPDGSHFDPWIRLHERVGGVILAPAPASTRIDAPVADWEAWTGLELPEDGEYVVPQMLAPLVVADGVGTHVEPNVWLCHRL